MTDLETREDDWARGVFDRVRTGQHEPHWIPDAVAAARLSSRRRTRHRAAGALAAVAVVGLSASAFTTLGGSVFRGRDTVSPGADETAWHGLDLTKYVEIDSAWKSDRKNATGHLSQAGLTTISTVLQRLDPGLSHVRTPSGRHSLDVGPDTPSTTDIEIQAHGYWIPEDADGFSFPRPFAPFRPKTPVGHVTITPMAPHVGQQVTAPDKPCGLGTLTGNDQIPEATAWSPCVRAHQDDGSDIVVTHSVHLPAGTVTVAARLFPDGSAVQIIASTVIGYKDMSPTGPSVPPKFEAGPALNPVPWSDDSLAQALSGPQVKGLP